MPINCGNKCHAITFDKSIASMEDNLVHLHIFSAAHQKRYYEMCWDKYFYFLDYVRKQPTK